MRKKTTQIPISSPIESLKKSPFFGTVWSLWPLEGWGTESLGLLSWEFHYYNPVGSKGKC